MKFSKLEIFILINVKIPTFNIYEQDKIHAKLSWDWKKGFIMSGPGTNKTSAKAWYSKQ